MDKAASRLHGMAHPCSGVDTLYITRPFFPPIIYSVWHILTLLWFMSYLGPLSNVRGRARGDKYFWTESFCPNNSYKCRSQRRGANMDNTT